MDFNRCYGWSGKHCIQTECKYCHGFSFQIYEELDNLASEYSNIVSKLQIGQSYEKRPLYVLKVWSYSISWTLSVHMCMDILMHLCIMGTARLSPKHPCVGV